MQCLRITCEAIKEDVVAMEEGGQWPLSCYTPSKDFGSFPGFHDTSMEEVRYEAYEAQVSGTFDQYVKKIENLIQATRMKWGMLKNPTGQVMSVIEKMAGGQGVVGDSSSAGLPSFSFSAAFNSSVQPQQKPQPPPSGFSLGGNMAFVVPQSPGSMFSAGTQPTTPSPNFTFTLMAQSASSSPFAAPAVPQSSHTGPPTGFGAAQVFGQSGGLLFGGIAPIPGNVQQPLSTGFFGASPVAEEHAFGVSPGQTTGTVFGSSTTGYGASVIQPGTAVPQPQYGNLGIYTPLTELTEAEQKEFAAVTFTIGSVPLMPPPSELCV